MMFSVLVSVAFLASVPMRDRLANALDARIAEADVQDGRGRFVGYPGGAGDGRFKPNPKFWLKDVDFSCASPWNSNGGSLKAGTLISPKHIIFAAHFPISTGTRILFVDNEGQGCPCYVERVKQIGKTDIMIGSLNAEVTPNIHPAKVLPPDYEKFIGDGAGLPVVTFDKSERTFVTELAGLPDGKTGRVWNRPPKTPLRQRLGGKAVGGDSGNPAFLVFGKTPVLLYCLKEGGAGSGPWLHLHLNEIQVTMDELCPGYKLETFDFSPLQEKSAK